MPRLTERAVNVLNLWTAVFVLREADPTWAQQTALRNCTVVSGKGIEWIFPLGLLSWALSAADRAELRRVRSRGCGPLVSSPVASLCTSRKRRSEIDPVMAPSRSHTV